MHIVLKTKEGEKRIEASEATIEELREWVNQAPDSSTRTLRKKLMYAFLYSKPPNIPKSKK
jgi:hypothetical protein